VSEARQRGETQQTLTQAQTHTNKRDQYTNTHKHAGSRREKANGLTRIKKQEDLKTMQLSSVFNGPGHEKKIKGKGGTTSTQTAPKIHTHTYECTQKEKSQIEKDDGKDADTQGKA
jgi:hypothetical protein